ncbi:MerR family transcriptional regulator [Enterococcus sp. BWM-S5]|uniref:MerR family transcriptional regulator n=1 Tax=Enterococcus larvae TaxID=2794352 RepID=A0ABS4CJ71_9ENTE|nr:MerR family transcriptional regulator [Enterococcus larvae]MBP1046666.1 MerR family transcriptional regulator [Enterococcus larvae]
MNLECKKEEEKLYRIGMFSRMNHVTIKALRHYDDVGLLNPQFIDPENGYRYYSSSQLPVLHQLIALRKIGFSLDEIKQAQSGTHEENLLKRKKQQLMKEIADRMTMLSLLEGYVQTKDEETAYHPVIKELPEVTVAAMRIQLPNYGALFSHVPAMGAEMEQLGCECIEPGYCFNIYHDGEYREEDIDAEICEAVVEKKEDSERITFKEFPKVDTAICVLHQGAYEGFPKAYAAAIRFIETNGYEIIGAPREHYIDGLWNKDTEEEWLTEIQFPVQKN